MTPASLERASAEGQNKKEKIDPHAIWTRQRGSMRDVCVWKRERVGKSTLRQAS